MLKAGLAIGTMQVASPFLVKALGEEPIKMGLDDPFIHRLSIMSNVDSSCRNHFSLLSSPHERRRQREPKHRTARYAARRLGTRLRQLVHGYLIGDDPRSTAGLFNFSARRQCRSGRADRRRGRSDRLDL